jgi:uncharacterized protein (DUF924 family)
MGAGAVDPEAAAVLEFWVGFDPDDETALNRAYERWFSSSPERDRALEARFGPLVARASAGGLAGWATASRERLALIVLLDQFRRNLYRGSAEAFALDSQALELTREGIAAGLDAPLGLIERVFFYMPLQHAESAEVQAESVRVFDGLSAEHAPESLAKLLSNVAKFAHVHADIIARFGRFPHRNRQLGRTTTEAEAAFLREGGPTFGQ